jgi:hypothetical protein
MAMGGFTGSDPAITLAEFKSDVGSGKLRFVLVSTSGGSGFDTSDRSSWVMSACKAVNYGGSGSLYDCAGAGG